MSFVINNFIRLGTVTTKLWYFLLEMPGFSLLDRVFYGVKLPKNYGNIIKAREMEEIEFTKIEFPELSHQYLENRAGERIHYVYGGKPNKPLMLFVHGFPESWYSWRYQLKEFCNDYFVVAIDMRGYNLSFKPSRRKDYSIRYLMEDLEDVILHFQKKDCILVAHDWGAAVAWGFVTSSKASLIQKLIILSTPHPLTLTRALGNVTEQSKNSWYFYLFQWPFLAEPIVKFTVKTHDLWKQLINPGSVSEKDKQRAATSFILPGVATASLNYYRNWFDNVRYLVLQPVTIPTLLMFGKQDHVLCEELRKETAKLAANSRVQYFDGSHWLQQDAATQVNLEIRDFLKNM